MISSIKHKQSISWTFLNDAVAFSAKEMPKNHTDKERFAAALSCIQTGILTLLLPLKRRRSSPSPFISHRVIEAVASWILKSLLALADHVIKTNHGIAFNEATILRANNNWHQRKILEAWKINCAKDPFNRDDGAYLPLTLAHIFWNFNQRLVYICDFVCIFFLSLLLKKVRDCDRNVGIIFIVNTLQKRF